LDSKNCGWKQEEPISAVSAQILSAGWVQVADGWAMLIAELITRVCVQHIPQRVYQFSASQTLTKVVALFVGKMLK